MECSTTMDKKFNEICKNYKQIYRKILFPIQDNSLDKVNHSFKSNMKENKFYSSDSDTSIELNKNYINEIKEVYSLTPSSSNKRIKLATELTKLEESFSDKVSLNSDDINYNYQIDKEKKLNSEKLKDLRDLNKYNYIYNKSNSKINFNSYIKFYLYGKTFKNTQEFMNYVGIHCRQKSHIRLAFLVADKTIEIHTNKN